MGHLAVVTTPAIRRVSQAETLANSALVRIAEAARERLGAAEGATYQQCQELLCLKKASQGPLAFAGA